MITMNRLRFRVVAFTAIIARTIFDTVRASSGELTTVDRANITEENEKERQRERLSVVQTGLEIYACPNEPTTPPYLTTQPVAYHACIDDFWNTASRVRLYHSPRLRRADDVVRLTLGQRGTLRRESDSRGRTVHAHIMSPTMIYEEQIRRMNDGLMIFQ